MADPNQAETYDHLARRTIVDGKRVSEIKGDHPDIFGNMETEEQVAARIGAGEVPAGMREVASSVSMAERATQVPPLAK